MNKDDALSLARAYKQLLQKDGIPVQSVILFGSCARGEATPESDIDLAVIGTSFLASRQEEAVAVRKTRWPLSMKIHPVWMHAGFLENTFSTLAQEIKKDGVEV